MNLKNIIILQQTVFHENIKIILRILSYPIAWCSYSGQMLGECPLYPLYVAEMFYKTTTLILHINITSFENRFVFFNAPCT